MKTSWIIALFAVPSLALATEKASVKLEDGGYMSSGGAGRAKEVKIKMSKGIGKSEISMDEQIVALRQQLEFLKLVKKHGLDPGKAVDMDLKDRPLKEVLGEVLPKVPVKFEGVEETVTVGSLVAKQAPLAQVVEYLDDAAGVYFLFSEDGIAVVAKPVTE